MNLLGEGFPDEIIKQIETRQQIYGSGYANGVSRSNDQLVYLNANTAWCKLVSSTNIVNPKVIVNKSLKDLENITGNQLAKKFILFNGTADANGRGLREGIDYSKILLSDSAYGIGGTEFGLRPMMGIQSIAVNHENRGSLRTATIKLKAWNRIQFDIIDILYLRLGYNVLLEWGNSMYYDNNLNLITKQDDSLANDFIEGNLSYNDFLKKIADRRLETYGNYEAMFAKVKNFSWSFMQDGSYDITLDLVSSGDIIESLKMNVLMEDYTKSIQDLKESDTDLDAEDLIDNYARKNSIGSFFYFLKHQLDNLDAKGKSTSIFNEWDAVTFSFGDITTSDISSQNSGIRFGNGLMELVTLSLYNSNPELDNKILIPNTFESGKVDAMKINWDNHGEEYYVRLGTLLAYIQNNIIPLIPDNKDKYIPLLNFDYQTETNIMYLNPLQISVDPRICVVNRSLTLSSGYLYNTDTEYKFAPAASPFVNKSLLDIDNVQYGNIMNIYMNTSFVLKKIDELKDDKNKTSLIDFLKGILEGVNGALGGINSLEPIIDETTNTVKIIDQNPLPNIDKVIDRFNSLRTDLTVISNALAEFDLYGYKNDKPEIYSDLGHASFIKEFNFSTEIGPNFSTMITVGAAANNSVVGENATALSRLNVGLEDRFKTEILDIYSVTNKKPVPTKEEELANKTIQEAENREKIEKRYGSIYEEYVDFLVQMSPTDPYWDNDDMQELNSDQIDIYKDTLVNIIQFEQQLNDSSKRLNLLLRSIDPDDPESLDKDSFCPNTGFIPFNLSLTMDGLSGMKIYSKFIIDSSYLPSNYPENVEFLIKNITHEIQNNKWYTKIDSFYISKGKYEETLVNFDPKNRTQNQNIPSDGPLPTSSTNGKWATELRKVIAQLGYTEKGNELDSGGDISENIYKATSSVLKTIKKEIPEASIKLTSGRDRYHAGLSYASRHKIGNAVDLVITPPTPTNLDKMVNILQRYAAGNSPNFRFIDEYRNPTKKATGNHFHISWGAGTESQIELNKALALAKQNKILPITIA